MIANTKSGCKFSAYGTAEVCGRDSFNAVVVSASVHKAGTDICQCTEGRSSECGPLTAVLNNLDLEVGGRLSLGDGWPDRKGSGRFLQDNFPNEVGDEPGVMYAYLILQEQDQPAKP